MTNKKLIFFDIDGTLMDHNKVVPESTKRAIKQLKEKGHIVAIATGRAPFMYEELREQLEIDTYVSFNGQYVVINGEPIYKNPLDKKGIELLTHVGITNQNPLVYMDHENMKANAVEHLYIQESVDSLKLKDNILSYEPLFYEKNQLYQSLLFCTQDQEEEYIKYFKEFDFIRWHEYSVDVLPAGGSKAKGIQKVMDALGFKVKDVYAFGDGLNDLEMIQFVGYGVAMGNAHESLKDIAKYITANVDEDGIFKGLKMLNLL